MERLLRLNEFWNWLPAFRAVAETSHLPSASKALQVSASSLSRTIHLLEENLGRDLFDREGRNLELNENGERFLAAVRDAMRLIDDGLCDVTESPLSGSLHISAADFLTDVLLPVLQNLHSKHSRLICHL